MLYTGPIVISGVGLTSPLGDDLASLRQGLLEKRSGITHQEIRHMGTVAMGLCQFDEVRYQKKKNLRRGTRAGSIAIFCANEALRDAKVNLPDSANPTYASHRIGVYLGITEHGNVETEEEIHQLYQNNMDIKLWSHHHNPRTVANSPAGEVTLNLKITGPHYTIGAACAAGNLGLIQGLQMLRLGEVDVALAGGVSEGPRTFGIFAAFQGQGALGHHQDPTLASRPLDVERNGIVVSEGGAIYVLERLDDALKRGAKIYAEVSGYSINSDALDYVLPSATRQIECIHQALEKANLSPEEIDIVNLHATGTKQGDLAECEAVSNIFNRYPQTAINASKGHMGHCMGAAGALELAGNLPSFDDCLVHPIRGVGQLDPQIDMPGLVLDTPLRKEVKTILNNSFGMLGINSTVIVKKFNA